MALPKPVKLDGTTLEGGGQLLRLAIGLSALTHTPLQITSIRGARRGAGGLKLQHLRAVEWLTAAASGICSGASVGSKEIQFNPPTRNATATRNPATLPSEIQIGSPGSVCLVAQAILPYLIFAGALHPERSGNSNERKVTIHGGTNVSLSPSFEYMQHVLVPTLAKIGVPPVSVQLHRRGWTGRKTQIGSITLTVQPIPKGTTLPSWSLVNRGQIERIEAYGIVPESWKERLELEITKNVSKTFSNDMEIEFNLQPATSMGMFYLLLVAVSSEGHRLGRDSLCDVGAKTKNLEKIASGMAKDVVKQLQKELEHGGCVDEYMRDQLVVFQALADGKCEVDVGEEVGIQQQPSLHAETVAWVTEEILGVRWKKNGTCNGVSFMVGGSQPLPDDVIDSLDSLTVEPA